MRTPVFDSQSLLQSLCLVRIAVIRWFRKPQRKVQFLYLAPVCFVSSTAERALGKGEVKVQFFHEAPVINRVRCNQHRDAREVDTLGSVAVKVQTGKVYGVVA